MFEPATRAKLAALAAQVLDEAKTPNEHWGWVAAGLIGNDVGFPEVQFVVPDSLIKSTTETLVDKGLPLYTDPDCIGLRRDRYEHRRENANPSPQPQAPTHQEGPNGEILFLLGPAGGVIGTNTVVSLEIKSPLVAPQSHPPPPPANGHHLMLSNYSGRLPPRPPG
ncbi:hypothetical protein BDW68DRAFT_183330 [Aspergillus falconensis]